MLLRSRLAGLALGASALSLILCEKMHAQDASVPIADEDVLVPDVVVVTARRRKESGQELPGAVTAITGDQQVFQVLETAGDFLRQAPGAALVASGPDYLSDVSIRGQGGGRLGYSESSTGIYRDGVYSAGGGFGGRVFNRMDIFDLSRIEILKGPQGALFGRNSVGGSVNILSKEPENRFGTSGRVSVTDGDERLFEAILNAPLTEGVSARIGGFDYQVDGGPIVNAETGEAISDRTERGLRAGISFAPASRLSGTLTYEISTAEAPAFSVLGRRATRADGAPLDPGIDARTGLSRVGRTDIDEESIRLKADYELTGMTLSFRGSHSERKALRYDEDGDHFDGLTGIDLAPGPAVVTPDYYGGESEDFDRTVLQAYLSSDGRGPVTWLAGAEWMSSVSAVRSGLAPCGPYTGTAVVQQEGCRVGGAGPFTPLDGANALQRANWRNLARLRLREDAYKEKLNSWSLFGAAEWTFAPDWNAGLELRVQTDEKDLWFQRYSVDPLTYFGPGPPPPGMLAPIMADPDGAGPLPPAPVQFCRPELSIHPCGVGLEAAVAEGSRSWTFWTPAATLRHRFAQDQNAYLRFATGYRPGGFNSNMPQAVTRTQINDFLTYDPEYAYSGEAGWKGALFGGAIRAEAALYYTWTNEVLVTTIPTVASRGFLLVNAGDAEVYGFESALMHTRELGPGRLVARATYSTQAGTFDSGASVPVANTDPATAPATPTVYRDISGTNVPNLRDYQVSLNLLYTFRLTGSLRAFASAGGQWADGGVQGALNGKELPAQELYDMRLGVSGDGWRASVFGRNLSDDRTALIELGGNDFHREGRVIGLELRLDR